LEQLCIKSFLEHGHRFVLYAYQDIDGVPRGCQVEDARAIVPEAEIFVHGPGILAGSPALFSDRFRYELLKAQGEWWVDTDVLCLRRDIPSTAYAFAKQDDHTYVGGILKAPRESEFLARALARARACGGDIAMNELGPVLVNQLVRELGLEKEAWAPGNSYPLGWDRVLEFLDPSQADSIEERTAASTFVHFSTNMLRIANVLKDVRPPQDSYLDRMYTAYRIEFPAHPRYEWSEIEPQYAFERAHWGEGGLLRAEVQRLRSKTVLIDELQWSSVELQEQLDAKGIETEALANELALARQENTRMQQSVTIQLFRKVSRGFYGLVGRQSLLGRSVQALLRLIGRVVLRSTGS
jgi:hypothetical protein